MEGTFTLPDLTDDKQNIILENGDNESRSTNIKTTNNEKTTELPACNINEAETTKAPEPSTCMSSTSNENSVQIVESCNTTNDNQISAEKVPKPVRTSKRKLKKPEKYEQDFEPSTSIKIKNEYVKKNTPRGPNPKVKTETIYEALKDLPLFFEDGELKKMTHPIWNEALALVPGIKMHNLYQLIYQDRHDIKTRLMEYKNLDLTNHNLVKLKKKKRKREINLDTKWDDYDIYDTLDTEDEEENYVYEMDILMSMKKESYKNSIHKIGIKPFQVFYWKPEQLTAWRDLVNLQPTVSLIVINNIVARIQDQFSTNDIFMVALASNLESSIVPLAQMLSDSLDTSDVYFFLNTWLQNKIPIPKDIVVGYYYTLLEAVSLGFNFCSFESYNLSCYHHLLNEALELPSTFVHIDIMSIVKVVDCWECFQGVDQTVKDLYICGIMYLSTIDNMSEFEEAITNLFTLCQSPFENDETETRRISLWAHLTSETIQNLNKKFIQLMIGKNGPRSFSYLDIEQNINYYTVTHPIYDYINQMKLQAFELCNLQAEDSAVEPNLYYCPMILEKMVQLLCEFPAWTRIILKDNARSSLSAICTSEHLSLLHEIKAPAAPSEFMDYHFKKLKKMTDHANRLINAKKRRKELISKNYDNQIYPNHSVNNIQSDYANRIEIVIPTGETEIAMKNKENENTTFDTTKLKESIECLVKSLTDFDDFINNILQIQLKPGDEVIVCKILLDCCAGLKMSENFIGSLAMKLCLNNPNFSSAFKQIFLDCYNTTELSDKCELKNNSKVFAHLLMSNSISWEILSVIRLNEIDITTAKKTFIKFLFKELLLHIGSTRFIEQLESNAKQFDFSGLFPTSSKNITFAMNFYKSIGLKNLKQLLMNKKNKEDFKPFEHSDSDSSVSSASSSENLVLELRICKKGKDHTKKVQNHRIVIKK